MKYTENDAIRWLVRANPVTDRAPLSTEEERARLRATFVNSEPVAAQSRLSWRPRFTLAAAAMVLLLVTLTVVFPALKPPSRAQALTPAPLAFADTPTGPLDMLNRLKSTLRSTENVEAKRQSDYIGWFTELRPDEDVPEAVLIAPQRVRLTWEADLSGTQIVEAAQSYWADPSEKSPPLDAPPPGTVLSDTTFAAGEFGVPFTEMTARSATEMGETLRAVGLPDVYSAADVIDAADALLSLWTLNSAQHEALLTLLGETGDAHLLGITTDRLGRTVVGFSAESKMFPGTQRILLVEQATGLLVGIEVTRITAEPPLPTGAVVSYKLWKEAR